MAELSQIKEEIVNNLLATGRMRASHIRALAGLSKKSLQVYMTHIRRHYGLTILQLRHIMGYGYELTDEGAKIIEARRAGRGD